MASSTSRFHVPIFGGRPRDGMIPPKSGPSITSVRRIWFIALGILYLIAGFLYAPTNHYGNLLFYPLIFLDAFIVYQLYQRYVRQMRIDNQQTRFADLFRQVYIFHLLNSFLFSSTMFFLYCFFVYPCTILVLFSICHSLTYFLFFFFYN